MTYWKDIYVTLHEQLQSFVDISRTAAFRRIAGDIPEFAFFKTGRTLFRKRFRLQYEPAFPAFPERLSTFRTGIVIERFIGLIPADRTFFNSHFRTS